MADISGLTQAQIDTLAVAGVDRPVTVTPHLAFAGSQITFYVADASSPSQGVHVVASNNGVVVDRRVADIVGPASATTALTGAQATALLALLRALHVFLLHP